MQKRKKNQWLVRRLSPMAEIIVFIRSCDNKIKRNAAFGSEETHPCLNPS
jgi:hypothetical protein